jgi:glutathione S-transferase
MNKLVLYWSIGSQPGRAVKTLLDIGKIPHESQRLNVSKNEHKGDEYLKIYPLGLIPAIKQGDFVLGESNAILTYLCERYPQVAHYHGRDIFERAIVNQHLSWYQNNFRNALFKPFRRFLTAANSGTPLRQEQVAGQWQQMWESIGQFNRIMERSAGGWVAGERPSIADFLYFYELSNLAYFGVGHEQYQAVSDWYRRVGSIP